MRDTASAAARLSRPPSTARENPAASSWLKVFRQRVLSKAEYVDAMRDPRFVQVGGGALALTHRPRLRDVPRLPASGVTHVVTLLNEGEGAKEIGEAVRDAGPTWIWCPLDNGQPPDARRTAELQSVIDELASLVANGATVLVHCSAGIHRTGMFGYALLRRLGLEPAAARAKLTELRAVTGEGVGAKSPGVGDALSPP